MALRLGAKKDVLGNLRSILRVLKKRSSQDKSSSELMTDYVLAQYRANQCITDRQEMKLLRAKATDYLHLLTSLEEQKYLWQLDAGIEKRFSGSEIVSKSARLVGLQLPDDFSTQEQVKEETH